MPQADNPLVESLLSVSRSLLGIVIRSVAAAPVAVTIPQHRVLVLLNEDEPLGIGVLAAELGVNPSNASRLCDRLERVGLVARSRSPHDRRAVLVELTDRGRRNLEAVDQRRREEIAALVAQLDGRGTLGVVAALDAVSAAARDVELAVTGRGRARSASS